MAIAPTLIRLRIPGPTGAGGIIVQPPPTRTEQVSFDPTGIPGATATDVQSMGAELYGRGTTTEERLSVNSNAGDALNLVTGDVTIPVDYLGNASVQFTFNGVYMQKGVEAIRVSSTSFRLPLYDTVVAEDETKVINYPS